MVVVAALAIVALVGAAALPTMAGYSSLQRAAKTKSMITSLEASMSNGTNTKPGFLEVVGNVYPSHFSMLNIPITTSEKRCGANTVFSGGGAGQVTKWLNGGPFSGFTIAPWTASGSGLRTPIGVIKDSVYKISGSFIAMKIDSVGTEDARNLDFLIDGGSVDSTTGNVTWVAATGITAGTPLHLVTIQFTNVGSHC